MLEDHPNHGFKLLLKHMELVQISLQKWIKTDLQTFVRVIYSTLLELMGLLSYKGRHF